MARGRRYSKKTGMKKMNNKTKMAKGPLQKYVKTIAKEVFDKRTETKQYNCPSGQQNAWYAANGGIAYLVSDVFNMPQGVEDASSTTAKNRIGDKIKAIGFKLCYDFSLPANYSVGSSVITLGYVKLRVMAFQMAPNVPIPTYPLIFDTNYNPTQTYTQQPINWGEGYVKKVLYDKTYCLKNNNAVLPPGGQIPFTNVLQFRKYIPFDKFISYTDENSADPNQTTKRVFVTLTAEYDTPNTVTPTGTKILYISGYTQAWFKDA